MIYYTESTMAALTAKHMHIINEHHAEVERSDFNLDPDYNLYDELEENDNLCVVIARDSETRKLVGYIVDIYGPSLHYKGQNVSVNDMLYVRKEYRKKGVAKILVTYADNILKEKGVVLSIRATKIGNPCPSMMKGRGYTEHERNWFKRH